MGGPPCTDNFGVKKGPWTPEEDMMLVSYVQEHGPGNWRAVPSSTGLRRCSKSCRLRWTNHLRPGIRRGSFTDHEEKMIIPLQSLLGNKWAIIASYLPERTDNDIKNYWNTHFKKKLKRLQNRSSDQCSTDKGCSSNSHLTSRGQRKRRLQADIGVAKQTFHDALSFENTNHLSESLTSSIGCFDFITKAGRQAISYASCTENMARQLKEWMKSTAPESEESKCLSTQDSSNVNAMNLDSVCCEETTTPGTDLSEPFHETLLGFETFELSNCDEFSRSTSPGLFHGSVKSPLTMIASWLLDDRFV